jgi:hypothetical protein
MANREPRTRPRKSPVNGESRPRDNLPPSGQPVQLILLWNRLVKRFSWTLYTKTTSWVETFTMMHASTYISSLVPKSWRIVEFNLSRTHGFWSRNPVGIKFRRQLLPLDHVAVQYHRFDIRISGLQECRSSDLPDRPSIQNRGPRRSQRLLTRSHCRFQSTTNRSSDFLHTTLPTWT